MAKRALILVDLQNDFIPGGALAVPEGDQVVAIANRLQKSFELVVATQDWHPRDHGSFAANNPGAKPGEIGQLAGLPQVMWPIHCVQNTPGAALVAELNTSRIRRIFQKGTDKTIDSYSGFFDNGKRKATGLGDFLRNEQVEQVYVVGLATDYCVKFTALDAKALGLDTYLVRDACRGVELAPGDVQKALEELKAAGVEIVQSSSIA